MPMSIFRQSLFSDEELQAAVDQHHVTVRKHPDFDLWIYNYTSKAQYDNAWTDVTMNCRGMICNETGRILARPFKKFFWLNHYSQPEELFKNRYVVAKKYDGSLGVLYRPSDDAQPMIATRGSFESDQALKGTQMLWEKYPDFEPRANMTYLFEIIYPQNRIILNYGNAEELVLLDVLGTLTGHSYVADRKSGTGPEFMGWSGPIAENIEVPPGTTPAEILAMANPDGSEEGFVISFLMENKPPLRVKMKTVEYVRLHWEKFALSNIVIWEQLRAGKPIQEIVGECPDEYYGWVKGIVADMYNKYMAIMNQAMDEFREIVVDLDTTVLTGPNRAEFAKRAKMQTHVSLMFAIWDGNQTAVEKYIYNLIRPVYEPAYIVSEEGDVEPPEGMTWPIPPTQTTMTAAAIPTVNA